jgi:hypothetical protein
MPVYREGRGRKRQLNLQAVIQEELASGSLARGPASGADTTTPGSPKTVPLRREAVGRRQGPLPNLPDTSRCRARNGVASQRGRAARNASYHARSGRPAPRSPAPNTEQRQQERRMRADARPDETGESWPPGASSLAHTPAHPSHARMHPYLVALYFRDWGLSTDPCSCLLQNLRLASWMASPGIRS